MEKEKCEKVVEMLEKYIRYLIDLSQLFKVDHHYKIMTVDQFNDFCETKHLSYNQIVGLKEYGEVQFSNQDLNTMFGYMKEYFMSREVCQYPDSRWIDRIFEDIFSNMLENMSMKDSRYQEVLKFYRASVYMNRRLICPEFSGCISNYSKNCFEVQDYYGFKFISCSVDECEVSDFTPIIFHNDVKVCVDDQMNLLSYGIVLENGEYYSLIDRKRYKKMPENSFSLDYIIYDLGCTFIEPPMIYRDFQLSSIIQQISCYKKMSESEREELERTSCVAAEWLLDFNLKINPNEIDSSESWSVLSTKISEVKDEQKQLFLENYKNKIKTKLLSSSQVYVEVGDRDITTILKSTQIPRNPSLDSVEMRIKMGSVRVQEGDNDYITIYSMEDNKNRIQFSK